MSSRVSGSQAEDAGFEVGDDQLLALRMPCQAVWLAVVLVHQRPCASGHVDGKDPPVRYVDQVQRLVVDHDSTFEERIERAASFLVG